MSSTVQLNDLTKIYEYNNKKQHSYLYYSNNKVEALESGKLSQERISFYNLVTEFQKELKNKTSITAAEKESFVIYHKRLTEMTIKKDKYVKRWGTKFTNLRNKLSRWANNHFGINRSQQTSVEIAKDLINKLTVLIANAPSTFVQKQIKQESEPKALSNEDNGIPPPPMEVVADTPTQTPVSKVDKDTTSENTSIQVDEPPANSQKDSTPKVSKAFEYKRKPKQYTTKPNPHHFPRFQELISQDLTPSVRIEDQVKKDENTNTDENPQTATSKPSEASNSDKPNEAIDSDKPVEKTEFDKLMGQLDFVSNDKETVFHLVVGSLANGKITFEQACQIVEACTKVQNINSEAVMGFNVLHYAVSTLQGHKDQLALINLLIDKGADPKLSTTKQLNALVYSLRIKETPNLEIVKVLAKDFTKEELAKEIQIGDYKTNLLILAALKAPKSYEYYRYFLSRGLSDQQLDSKHFHALYYLVEKTETPSPTNYTEVWNKIKPFITLAVYAACGEKKDQTLVAKITQKFTVLEDDITSAIQENEKIEVK